MNRRLVPALVLFLMMAAGAAAFEDEVKAYQQVLARVCTIGVTAELQRL